MHRTLGIAVSAMIAVSGLSACNKAARQEKEDAAAAKATEVKEEAKAAVSEVKEGAENAAAEVKDKSASAAQDIKEGAQDAAHAVKQEAVKAGTAIKEGAQTAGAAIKTGAETVGAKVKEETRQTARDVQAAVAADRGKTPADEALTKKIRAALKADKVAAREASDVGIETNDGKVRLIGTVASEESKKEIARVAGKVAGTAQVTDEVKVAERVGAKSAE